MYMGKIVEDADVDTLFYRPMHPYTQALLQSIPRLGQKSKKKLVGFDPCSVPDPYSIPRGCPFHPRCSKMIKGVCNTVDPKIMR